MMHGYQDSTENAYLTNGSEGEIGRVFPVIFCYSIRALNSDNKIRTFRHRVLFLKVSLVLPTTISRQITE